MNLQLQVTLDEANTILRALGQLPFVQVYELIGKLNSQANEQLAAPSADVALPDGEGLMDQAVAKLVFGSSANSIQAEPA